MLSRSAWSFGPSHAVEVAPGQGCYHQGMATMARRDLIKLYELANLSSCRHGTLHQHDPGQLPLRQNSPDEDPPERVHARLHPKKGLVDGSSAPPPSVEATPSQAKTASTAPGSLKLNITLRIHERICKSSPRLPSLSLRNHRGIQALTVRRKEERQ